MATRVKLIPTTTIRATPTPSPIRRLRITGGIQGPTGAPGSGYIHTQGSASASWTVNHNLAFSWPSVEVMTSGGVETEAQVTHTSPNQTVLTFNTAISGIARFS